MPDLTPDRLARLRALATEATPGPWDVEDQSRADWPGAHWTVMGRIYFGEDEGTARYVAAVSPDVVLGLLDEIEQLRAVIEDVRAEGEPINNTWGACSWCAANLEGGADHKPDCAWLKVEAVTDA